MPIKVCLGGTFIVIHNGHLALLKKAFEIGDEIYIGLSTDEMALRNREVSVQDYDTRLQNLNNILGQMSKGKRFFVFALEDQIGGTTTENYDAIVVSQETLKGAENINLIRERNGMKPLEIVVIDMVLAHDKKPISSTRVIRGQIDRKGNLKQ